MTKEQKPAFVGIRERLGLIAAAMVSAMLWMLLIQLARIAAHLV